MRRRGPARRQDRPGHVRPHRRHRGASVVGLVGAWGHHDGAVPLHLHAGRVSDELDRRAGGRARRVGQGRDGAGDLRDLFTDGAIAGVGGVLVFLPQILILLFFLGLLEYSGYMARRAQRIAPARRAVIAVAKSAFAGLSATGGNKAETDAACPELPRFR